MKTIHKYVLTGVANTVPTFEGARFLHVDNQREQITVWAEVETLNRECIRFVHVVGTGHPLPPGEPGDYVGSAVMAGGDFVFHIYAEKEAR
jgi:hypothetical protein